MSASNTNNNDFIKTINTSPMFKSSGLEWKTPTSSPMRLRIPVDNSIISSTMHTKL